MNLKLFSTFSFTLIKIRRFFFSKILPWTRLFWPPTSVRYSKLAGLSFQQAGEAYYMNFRSGLEYALAIWLLPFYFRYLASWGYFLHCSAALKFIIFLTWVPVDCYCIFGILWLGGGETISLVQYRFSTAEIGILRKRRYTVDVLPDQRNFFLLQ